MNRSAQPGISSTVGGVSLDTSGVVTITDVTTFCRPQLRHDTLVYWSDLSPFEQGYVEAMFACFILPDRMEWVYKRFSDLAPETLAAIRKDCALAGPFWCIPDSVEGGRHFWALRQKEPPTSTFPPQTPTLGDDGKVRFQ